MVGQLLHFQSPNILNQKTRDVPFHNEFYPILTPLNHWQIQSNLKHLEPKAAIDQMGLLFDDGDQSLLVTLAMVLPPNLHTRQSIRNSLAPTFDCIPKNYVSLV